MGFSVLTLSVPSYTDVPCKVNPLGVVEESPSRLGWVVF